MTSAVTEMTDTCDIQTRLWSLHRPCRRTILKWLPPFCLPATAALLGRNLPGWLLMWLMAFALLAGAKWITISTLVLSPAGQSIGKGRLLLYAFLWPGLDARRFCATRSVPVPSLYEWAQALGNTL